MKPNQLDDQYDKNSDEVLLDKQINLNHPLVRAAEAIDWKELESELEVYYADIGRPGKPVRLLSGLLMLKYFYDCSDEDLIEIWLENPYWQYFCGFHLFQKRPPIDPTCLGKFRKRLGEKGCEKILGASIKAGIKTKTVSKWSLKKVIFDTTVQPKNISYPIDSKLQNKARELLVKEGKKIGLSIRQTYSQLSKQSLIKIARYTHARQMNRAKKEMKKVKIFLGRVLREVSRKICDDESFSILKKIMEMSDHLLKRKKEDKNKMYSLHAPEVECISKGKMHAKYEFGVKVSVACTNKEGFIVGMKAIHGNTYDGHTLGDAINQVEAICNIKVQTGYVDKGYKGHQVRETQILMTGLKKLTMREKQHLKRRQAIEPVIGHMKNEGRFGKNYLLGKMGDQINAVLCGVGYNLKLILNKLKLSLAY